MTGRRSRWFGWMVALSAIAVFASLGFWQLGRMHQKQAMLDAVAHVLHARRMQPLDIAHDAARIDAYDWAAGRGAFSQAPPILLDNQQHAGQVGVRAYRIFQPEGDMPPILVELGWLPLPDRTRLPDIPVPSAHDISGLLMPPPSAGIGPESIQRIGDHVLLTQLKPDDIAATLALSIAPAPRILRLDPALPLGYARDLDILPNTLSPQRHLGYAVQWFGLAMATFVTALLLTWRRRRRRTC